MQESPLESCGSLDCNFSEKEASQVVKNPPSSAGDTGDAGSIPGLRRPLEWQPTPVFLPGDSSWTENLAGYNPWGHKELDATEVTEHSLYDKHPL